MRKDFLSLKIVFTVCVLGILIFSGWLMVATASDLAIAFVSGIGVIIFAMYFLNLVWDDQE